MATQITKRGIATAVKNLSAKGPSAESGGHGKLVFGGDCIISSSETRRKEFYAEKCFRSVIRGDGSDCQSGAMLVNDDLHDFVAE